MFAKRVEGRDAREFFHTLRVVAGQRFLIDFGVNFLPVGTPGGSRTPLGDQVVSQSVFLQFLCPFGKPVACLGVTLGVTWAPKAAKKE